MLSLPTTHISSIRSITENIATDRYCEPLAYRRIISDRYLTIESEIDYNAEHAYRNKIHP